jgi:type VII secretion protein EccB
MYNRRDQVQAHAFLEKRLVAAVLRAEPDGLESPLRRTPNGVLGGIIVAMLVVAGVLVMALLSPKGAQTWRKPGSLVVDKDTGASFVLVGDTLRPVLNLASARLLLGEKMTVAAVAGSTLAGVPRGNPVGIMGAPDTLPQPGDPARSWSVCAITVEAEGVDRAGVALRVDVAGEAPRPDERALLAKATDNSLHLVWRDRRIAVRNDWALRAIGIDPASAVAVRDSWLDALPVGPDLVAAVPSMGEPGPMIDGKPTVTGQMLAVPALPQRRIYLVAPDGLIPLTELATALLMGDPASAQAYGTGRIVPIEVSQASIANAAMLPALPWQAELPAAPPEVLSGDAAVDGGVPCLRTVTGGTTIGPVLVIAPEPDAKSAGADGPGVTRDAKVADRVVVGPGAGLLTRSTPAPGVTGAGLFLVTEGGVRFPVADSDAAAALGLPADRASAVPTRFIEMLPTGPLLSKAPTGP